MMNSPELPSYAIDLRIAYRQFLTELSTLPAAFYPKSDELDSYFQRMVGAIDDVCGIEMAVEQNANRINIALHHTYPEYVLTEQFKQSARTIVTAWIRLTQEFIRIASIQFTKANDRYNFIYDRLNSATGILHVYTAPF